MTKGNTVVCRNRTTKKLNIIASINISIAFFASVAQLMLSFCYFLKSVKPKLAFIISTAITPFILIGIISSIGCLLATKRNIVLGGETLQNKLNRSIALSVVSFICCLGLFSIAMYQLLSFEIEFPKPIDTNISVLIIGVLSIVVIFCVSAIGLCIDTYIQPCTKMVEDVTDDNPICKGMEEEKLIHPVDVSRDDPHTPTVNTSETQTVTHAPIEPTLVDASTQTVPTQTVTHYPIAPTLVDVSTQTTVPHFELPNLESPVSSILVGNSEHVNLLLNL